MNASQLNTIERLKHRANQYGHHYANGLQVTVSEEELAPGSNFVWVSIHPTELKWYETRMTICGSIGPKGGLKLSPHIEATKTEVYLYTK